MANDGGPNCLKDAPASVLELARTLAKATSHELVAALKKAYPGFDPQDDAWRDLVKGILLMAASEWG